MAFKQPGSGRTRMADIVAKRLGKGESLDDIRKHLTSLVSETEGNLVDTAIADGQRSIRFAAAVAAGRMQEANILLGLARAAGQVGLAIRAVYTVHPGQAEEEEEEPPTSESAVQILVPEGVSVQKVLGLLQAAADTAANMGAGADSLQGGTASDVTVVGVYNL